LIAWAWSWCTPCITAHAGYQSLGALHRGRGSVPGTSAVLIDIEAWSRAPGVAHSHTAGPCALRSVLDARMHVMGIGGLDFCDGSVLPSPVGGHPEANMYDVSSRFGYAEA